VIAQCDSMTRREKTTKKVKKVKKVVFGFLSFLFLFSFVGFFFLAAEKGFCLLFFFAIEGSFGFIAPALVLRHF